jgi:hypothetical protein
MGITPQGATAVTLMSWYYQTRFTKKQRTNSEKRIGSLLFYYFAFAE